MFRLKSYAAMFALVIGLLITFNQTARAQTCVTNPVVVNNLDSGAGSLRKAVIDVCAGGTITFSTSMPPEVLLTTGQIVIDKNLTIQGPGADRLTVRNSGASSRIFQVNTGVTATISGLTIEDGTNGGISNAGTLTVADCVIRSNKGSGIQNSGNLTVVNSVLSDNESGAGGAINNNGTAAITNSTILHNSARTGGGIYNAGSVTITNSSITGNTATGEFFLNGNVNTKVWGSAITNQNGSVTITNSTIAGNDDEGFASTNCFFQPNNVCRPGYGTAIAMVINNQGGSGGDLNLINSTITDNILINLFSAAPYSVTARNSIINGLWRFEAFATLNSQGYNLIVNSDGHNVIGDTTGNILDVNPRLGPFGYHGGSTMTHALLTGSPAINAGNTATSPATDQRGASRVGAADIGAFELNNSANGGNFVVQLPDAFTEIAYSHLLVEGGGGSLTGGALPTGISLSTTESSRVLVSGRTAQTGVFAFSFTGSDYRLRVLNSGLPPFGGCRSNVVVANKSDAGEGTLRQAVIDACAGGTITFGEAARGKIHLTGGPIAINKNLTIAGPGADALTLRSAVGSGFQNNVVLVNPGVTAVISGLTVSDGFAYFGGGIRNEGNLTVRNVILSNNRGIDAGGAIGNGNLGTLTLDRSLVTGNGFSRDYTYDRRIFVFEGGGIYSFFDASLTITDSTVSGNNADQGGGIYATSATITNTTISDNRVVNVVFGSAGLGGGLYLDQDGTTTLTNCTVSQNYVYNDDQSEGGGIYMDIFGTLSLINTTVAHNEIVSGEANRLHGAGISMAFAGALGTVNARNSIIAGNKLLSNNGSSSAAKQFYGTLTSQGYNLIGGIEGQIIGDTTGNIVAADPRLSPLGYYGGPTPTQALLTGSPAINAGNTATSPTTDQRGAARVGTADIGAFELNNSANGGTFVVQLPDGVVQTPYSYTITLDRGAFTYSLTGGALPTGISLSTNGAIVSISGTPSVSGVFNFAVTAANGTNTFVTNYSLRIFALPNGNFETADCSFISGWAWNPQQPNAPISVNIYADDNFVATVSANQFRQDLLDAGIGNGAHGFSFATPANLKDGQPHQIRVRIVSATSDLSNSPRTITCATPPDLTITKTHIGNFTQGDTGKTYSITVSNSGGTATSGLVSVSDALPGGLGAVNIVGTGWNCIFNNLTCTRTDALAAGASYPAITLTVNVAANAPGSVTNFASVSGGGETNTANNQSADPTTISAAPVPTGIEGDVASRPAGDNLILPNDAVQVQRFEIGFDRPFQSNEFQRADIAPANTRGNGVIDAADTIQAIRYQIGLDAHQSAGGPSALAAAPFAAADGWETAADLNRPDAGNGSNSRQLRVQSTFAGAGQPVTVNLLADALGDESAYGFTLSYDTARLTSPSVVVGTAGGSRFCNTATAGEIRCSVREFQMNNPSSSTDQIGEMAAGANLILAYITFTAPANAPAGAAVLTLTNVNASNDAAQSLATAAISGQVTIAGPTAASVSVSGRVLTIEGRGLTGATVTLTDASGGARTSRTGSFGYFRFKDVTAGQTYIFSVSSKRYSFPPQIVTVMEDLTELVFTAPTELGVLPKNLPKKMNPEPARVRKIMGTDYDWRIAPLALSAKRDQSNPNENLNEISFFDSKIFSSENPSGGRGKH